MQFLFVKQSAFICRTFIEDDQRVSALPGVPPCAESATGGAHGGNLAKYNVARSLKTTREYALSQVISSPCFAHRTRGTIS